MFDGLGAGIGNVPRKTGSPLVGTSKAARRVSTTSKPKLDDEVRYRCEQTSQSRLPTDTPPIGQYAAPSGSSGTNAPAGTGPGRDRRRRLSTVTSELLTRPG